MSQQGFAYQLDEAKYGTWRDDGRWRFFGFDLPKIQTPEDAAALIYIAMHDAHEQKSFADNLWQTSASLDNDGRSIGTIAALTQYKPELAVFGMGLLADSIADARQCAAEAIAYLNAVMNYGWPLPWPEAAMDKFLDYALTQTRSPDWRTKTFDKFNMKGNPPHLRAAYSVLGTAYNAVNPKSRAILSALNKAAMVELAAAFFEIAPELQAMPFRVLETCAPDEKIKALEFSIHEAFRKNAAQVTQEALKRAPDDRWRSDLRACYGEAAMTNPQIFYEAQIAALNNPAKPSPLAENAGSRRTRPGNGLIAPLPLNSLKNE